MSSGDAPTVPLLGSLDEGRFTLVRKIGSGGYGDVFEATQTSVDRRVAIKLVHEHLRERADVAERFRREARLTSRLDHRNAVRVIDFGDDGGQLYLAMEFVAGPTLKSVLKAEGPLAPRRAARIAEGLAAGLAAAHRIGLVHRDLKPANVLLAESDDGERPVIIDFGLVKVFGGEDDGAAVTRSNVMIGTPAYLSPEAVVGDEVDGRADLYALGVVLHEMLTGRRPFRGASALEVATSRLHGAAPALPATVPTRLADIVARLLERSPDDRPADAGEVRAALRAFVDSPERGPSLEETASVELGDGGDATRAPVRGPALRSLGGSGSAGRSAAGAGTPSTGYPRTPSPPLAPATASQPRWPVLGAVAGLILGAALLAMATFSRPDSAPARVAATAGDVAETSPTGTPAHIAPNGAAGVAPSPSRPLSAIGSASGSGVPATQEPAPRRAEASDDSQAADGSPVSTPAPSMPTGVPPVAGSAVRGLLAMAEDETRAPQDADSHDADSQDVDSQDVEARDDTARAERDRADAPTDDEAATPPRERRRAPDEPGSLRVNAEPWAMVFVNGRELGPSPVSGVELAPGEHEVRSVYADQERREVVTIRAGETTTVTHRFGR